MKLGQVVTLQKQIFITFSVFYGKYASSIAVSCIWWNTDDDHELLPLRAMDLPGSRAL